MIKRFTSMLLVLVLAFSVMSVATVGTQALSAEEVITAEEATPDEVTTPDEATTPDEEIAISEEAGIDKNSVEGLPIGYIGDADTNDVVNVRDATAVQKHVAGVITLTEKATALSDADLSGKVNVRDATAIQKNLAGLDVKTNIYHVLYIKGKHTHNYVPFEVEADCASEGYTRHSCVCGEEYKDNIVEAHGHKYQGVVTDPTCAKKGYTTYTCEVCQDSYKDDYTDPTRKHTYEDTVVEPNCTDGGYIAHTCTVCKFTYSTDFVSKRGHSYQKVVTAPTCHEEGYTTYTCSVCQDTYIDDYVSKLTHFYNSDGKCTACGDVIAVKNKTAEFDEVAAWMKKNGTLTEDGEAYGVATEIPDSQGVGTCLFYVPEYDVLEVLIFEEANGVMCWVDIERGADYALYDAYYGDYLVVEGSFSINSIKGTETNLHCNVVYDYYGLYESNNSVVETSTAQLTIAGLAVYEYYAEYFSLPANLKDLGFLNFDVTALV